jgi:hypothetical protein
MGARTWILTLAGLAVVGSIGWTSISGPAPDAPGARTIFRLELPDVPEDRRKEVAEIVESQVARWLGGSGSPAVEVAAPGLILLSLRGRPPDPEPLAEKAEEEIGYPIEVDVEFAEGWR